MGYEQMEDGGPFCFLAPALSRQQSQWGQDHWERSAADQQSGQYRLEDGGQHLAGKQHLPGSAVPSTENQAGGSYRDQGYGGQVGPLGLPHAALRDAIRGPRSRVLRGPAPPATDQVPQVESRQAWVPSHRSSGSLKAVEFLERERGIVEPDKGVLACEQPLSQETDDTSVALFIVEDFKKANFFAD